MRTIVILPIAAAALAAGAIGTWGLGLASPRAVILKETAAFCGPATAATASGKQPRATAVDSLRYRAETCSGDYVCGEHGAWEIVAVPAVLPAIHQ
jgi:hypothetical protein